MIDKTQSYAFWVYIDNGILIFVKERDDKYKVRPQQKFHNPRTATDLAVKVLSLMAKD